jgi:hypothetical protein
MKLLQIFTRIAWFVLALIPLADLVMSLTELSQHDYWEYLFSRQNSSFQTSTDLNVKNDIKEVYLHQLIELCLDIPTLATFLLLGFFNFPKVKNVKNIWTLSVVLSVLFTLSIVGICYISITYTTNQEISRIIFSPENLDKFMKERVEFSKVKREDKPIFIKTGTFIQNFEFNSANNIQIVGYIWQKYEYGKYDTTGLGQGFMLPEATEVEIEEAYRKNFPQKGYELVGWRIKAVLRETFNYAEYPFDFQNLWIRVWHKDFDKNVILIPDLESYRASTPAEKPGLENGMPLPNWEIMGSYFGYNQNSYNSNFGIENYTGQDEFPELYFCILIKRFFYNNFISEIVPIITVLVILYLCILVIFDQERKENEFFQFNIMEIIGVGVALIFVIILAHSEVRRNLPSNEVLYLEYYYFVMYFMIFGIIVNYLIFNYFQDDSLQETYQESSPARKLLLAPVLLMIHLVKYKSNLYTKAFFLPVITGTILIFTYIAFNHTLILGMK